ncbi:MAG: antibiotic biosynthesis monooxygenase [Bacteroidetes bacterium]|nr:antibiotic biosynthesis monooxygenase [Bacteroidota bacterium]
MIARIWHGYTTKQNATVYEDLLKEEIFKSIANKKMTGYKGIQLLKKEKEDECEFITIMWFENIENVKQFMGDEYEKAYVLPQAQKLLKKYDAYSAHYDLAHEIKY